MNAITNRASSNALASLQSLKSNLQNVATSIVTPGGEYLLRLVQGGWVYGAENVEVEANSEWAVNPLSLMHGWVAWTDYKKKKNEIVSEVMVPAGQPLPLITELREVKDDEGNVLQYSQQLQFQLQCLTGADKGEQVRYKAASVGGMNAAKELLNAIVNNLDEDPENPVPVLVLGVDSYQHKVWGKTFVPVFEIVDWVPLDDVIKPPLDEKEEPEADQKAPEAQPRAERQRTRQQAPAEQTAAITPEDRRAAIDGALQEVGQRRQQAQVEEPAQARTRRRR